MKKRLLAITILCTCFTNVFGQVQSTLGWFEVNYQQGCSPLDVSVTTSIPEADVPIFQFNGIDDPNQVQWRDSFTEITHTYSNAGSFMIYLTVQNATPVRSDSIQINVINSVTPTFELQNCSNNGVLINILDTFYDSYLIDFGDGNSTTVNSPTPSPSHLYATTGNYTITLTGQLANAPNNCGSLNQSFSATVNLIPPSLNSLAIDSANNIVLGFQLPQQANYRSEISIGNDQLFQFYSDLNPSETTLTIPGFNPDQNNFCFRLVALNPCGGDRVYSNVVCNINSSVSVVNNEIIVNWDLVLTGQEANYRISRNTLADFITIPAGTQTFRDQQVQCETEYCYTVTAIYTSGAESTSPPSCGTSFSTDTPPVLSNLSIDVATDGVRLDWENNPQIDTAFIAQYSSNNTLLIRDTTTVNARFISTDLKNFPQTCYTLSYRDICTNTSPLTPQICSVYLTTQSNEDGSITLNWTDFAGFQDSIASYSILKYDPSGNLIESIDVGYTTSYVDEISGTNDQIVTYVVEGTPTDMLFGPIHSNSVEAARRVQLIFPTAFTPDDDGLNDVFKPEYLFVKTFEMSIYNRWGEVIFFTNDIEEGWDGTFNGKKVPAEGYTYLANAEDFQGIRVARSGIVTVVKN